MPTILVTGAKGQLGQELQALLSQQDQASWIFTDREGLDIRRPELVKAFFQRYRIDGCINCAAYTAVDRAESEPEQATLINAYGVETLAKTCRDHSAALIHLSSDYVYHNSLNRPLREDDPAHPQGVYAITKLAGDKAALDAYPQTLILRTSWVYSSYGHNFVKTMLRLGRERDEIQVVCDQIGTPTYARDLAQALMRIIAREDFRQLPGGIFHFSNEGVCSWYDFAQAIFEYANIPCQVIPILSAEYPTPAQRPFYSVLDKTKFKSTFQQHIPYWRDSLQDCLQAIRTMQAGHY